MNANVVGVCGKGGAPPKESTAQRELKKGKHVLRQAKEPQKVGDAVSKKKKGKEADKREEKEGRDPSLRISERA